MTRRFIVVQAKISVNGTEILNAYTFYTNQEIIDYVNYLERCAYTGKIGHYEVWVEDKASGAMIPYDQWLKKNEDTKANFAGKFGTPKARRIYRTFY